MHQGRRGRQGKTSQEVELDHSKRMPRGCYMDTFRKERGWWAGTSHTSLPDDTVGPLLGPPVGHLLGRSLWPLLGPCWALVGPSPVASRGPLSCVLVWPFSQALVGPFPLAFRGPFSWVLVWPFP